MSATESLPKATLTIGTRTSKLALWQTEHVAHRLQTAWPGLQCHIEPFVTSGDKTLDKPLPRIGGKGVFTAEMEAALHRGAIDIAVHSLKDLPIEETPGLTLGAITSRADARDALVARNGFTLATLPGAAVVGTSSIRRQAQLLAQRPDLQIKPIRGNVDTRLRKVQAGEYDAAVLAAAGLQRLQLTDLVSEWLELAVMLPAPGQGALAVQCRADDQATLSVLAAIEEANVRQAVTAERAFLNGLGGGCSAPVAAYATGTASGLHLQALVGSPDGRQMIRVSGSSDDARALGRQLARQAIAQGADDILASLATTGGSQVLAGKRIVVTRARAQAAAFSRNLADLGAIPIEIPMIRIAPLPDTRPLDEALQHLDRYDWLILTSVNGVEIVWQRATAVLGQAPDPGDIKVATVGPATARALLERGIQPAFTPDEFIGEAVAAGMGALTGQRILLPRADIASPVLPDMLRARGAEVDAIAAYRTLPADIDAAASHQLAEGVDVLTFSSASAVRNWVAVFGDDSRPRHCLVACIGPVTARAAQELGLAPDIIPSEYTLDGLLQALVAHFRSAT